MNDPGARDVLDRAFVDLRRHRARDRRADHAAVHHARHLDVGDVVLRAEHHRRDVVARDRLADDLVLGVLLRLRLARGVELIADLLVPLELHVEVLAADQLGIGGLLVAVEGGADHAVDHDELIGRRAELLGRHVEQHAARFGRGHRASACRRTGCRSSPTSRPGSRSMAVWPMMTVTALYGTSSSSATIWPMAVNRPCAMSVLPKNADTRAVGVDRDERRQLIGRQRRLARLARAPR